VSAAHGLPYPRVCNGMMLSQRCIEIPALSAARRVAAGARIRYAVL